MIRIPFLHHVGMKFINGIVSQDFLKDEGKLDLSVLHS